MYNENEHPLYNRERKNIIELFSENSIKIIQEHRNLEFEYFGYSTDINHINELN
jgi:hypothetical protein